MRQVNRYDDELIQRIKEFYFSNEVSLDYVADHSLELFGRNIPANDIKHMSKTDLQGPWSITKVNKGLLTKDVPMAEKILNVANILYEKIFDESSELSPTQLAQIAKTWADLIDKTKLSKDVSTAKTPVQEAKDLIAELEAQKRLDDRP